MTNNDTMLIFQVTWGFLYDSWTDTKLFRTREGAERWAAELVAGDHFDYVDITEETLND
jgi:hypothetical protein